MTTSETLLPLAHKVAIVTGANRGIGRAIALTLTSQGATCVLAARDLDVLKAVATEATAIGPPVAVMSCDLREIDAPARLAALAMERFGAIDIIVNNAGATKRGDFLSLSDADWQDGYALKFFGAMRLCRIAWPHLVARRGSIINIAGIGGRTPGPDFAVGGSVNAALLALTKSLADLGVRDGVQVNAVNPGSVRTDRLAKRLSEIATTKGTDEKGAEREFLESSRVTQIGEPEDIANLVAFIVGPKGRFLHGSLIDIDGGATKTL